MKLYFLADAYLGTEKVYSKGETKEVTDQGGQSMKWVRRGVAIPAKDLENKKPELDQASQAGAEKKQSLELNKNQKEDIQEAPKSGNANKGGQVRNSNSKNKTQGSELL